MTSDVAPNFVHFHVLNGTLAIFVSMSFSQRFTGQ